MAWKLLSETRRGCLRAAWAGTAFVVLLVFLQSVSGALEGIAGLAWGWVALVALLPAAVLGASAVLNRFPAKIVHPTAHVALVWGTAAYSALLLLTLLAKPFANQSIERFLQSSLWWLLPIEALLLVGYWLVFYRKELIFKPDERILLDFAKQKAAEWRGKGSLLRQQAFEWIATGDLAAVFPKMREAFEKTGGENFKTALQLEGEFNRLSREKSLNLVDEKTAQLALNRITMAVINLAEKL
jgi:hypothetical protein